MVISLALLTLALPVNVFLGGNTWTKIYLILAGLLLSILTLIYLAADYFTGNGIDDSVVYHLQYGLTGAGFSEYINLIVASALLTTLALILVYYLGKRLIHSPGKISRLGSSISFLLLTSAIASHVATQELVALGLDSRVTIALDNASPIYANTTVGINEMPLNLIYIYLESLEQTYLDESLFPGLTPNLSAIAAANLTFTNIKQLPGTGWTIAGLTASQCGVPLVTKDGTNVYGEGNSMSGMQKFLPGAICMGDVLNTLGYQLSYTGGAALSFAGKGKFLRTHGFGSVEGKSALTKKLGTKKYHSSWGLYDDTLFDNTEQLLSSGSLQQPFGHFLLTLDTHNPKGHISASCQDLQYGDGQNPILNAVHCSDYLAGKLLTRLREIKIANESLIIISSDHLALKNTASKFLNERERKNLFIAIQPKNAAANEVSRGGSMLDVGVTVLNLMGIEMPKLGFGRNLLGEGETLIESHQRPGKFLAGQRANLKNLWSYPKIDQGLSFDPERNQLTIGTQVIGLPAIMEIDDNFDTTNIAFEFNAHRKLVRLMTEYGADQRLIWIDKCSLIPAFSINSGVDSDGYCIAAGRVGGANVLVKNFSDQTQFTYEELVLALSSKPSDEGYRRIAQQLKIANSYLEFPLPTLNLPNWVQLENEIRIYSSGHPLDGLSYIVTKNEVKLTQQKRGLSLIALSAQGDATLIAHVNLCKTIGTAEGTQDFAQLIEEANHQNSIMLVMTNHLAKCLPNKSTVDFYFENLPFKDWRPIFKRKAFIGLLSGGKVIHEKIGTKDGHLVYSVSPHGD